MALTCVPENAYRWLLRRTPQTSNLKYMFLTQLIFSAPGNITRSRVRCRIGHHHRISTVNASSENPFQLARACLSVTGY